MKLLGRFTIGICFMAICISGCGVKQDVYNGVLAEKESLEAVVKEKESLVGEYTNKIDTLNKDIESKEAELSEKDNQIAELEVYP